VNESLSGVVGALIAAFCWGSYLVPLKRYPELPTAKLQWWASVAIFVSSLLLWLTRGMPALSAWGVMAGLFWTLGGRLSFEAVRHEGLAGASTRWMGVGILTSFAVGYFVFHEAVVLVWGLGGLMLLLVGLAFAGGGPGSGGGLPWRSVLAGLVFGTYLVPLRLSGVSALDFAPPMALGILLGALPLGWHARHHRVTSGVRWLLLLAGLVWNVANVASFYAISGLGLAVGFPLTQLALVVSLAWGILAFGEVPGRKARLRIALGAALLLAGASSLGLGRALAPQAETPAT
jgi:glucose uptake protein